MWSLCHWLRSWLEEEIWVALILTKGPPARGVNFPFPGQHSAFLGSRFYLCIWLRYSKCNSPNWKMPTLDAEERWRQTYPLRAVTPDMTGDASGVECGHVAWCIGVQDREEGARMLGSALHSVNSILRWSGVSHFLHEEWGFRGFIYLPQAVGLESCRARIGAQADPLLNSDAFPCPSDLPDSFCLISRTMEYILISLPWHHLYCWFQRGLDLGVSLENELRSSGSWEGLGWECALHSGSAGIPYRAGEGLDLGISNPAFWPCLFHLPCCALEAVTNPWFSSI